MHGTCSSYWPFADLGAWIFHSLFFPALRFVCLDTEKFDVFILPFSTIFLSVT